MIPAKPHVTTRYCHQIYNQFACFDYRQTDMPTKMMMLKQTNIGTGDKQKKEQTGARGWGEAEREVSGVE